MRFLNTIVLLYREQASTPAPHPYPWYETYVFDELSGLAGFWLNQTNGEILITGNAVLDWAVIPPPDYSSRADIALKAMAHVRDHNRADLSNYDCVFVVIAVGFPTIAFEWKNSERTTSASGARANE